jgi:hypothetical protein
MMHAYLTATMLVTMSVALAAQSALPVGKLAVTAPRTVVELDMGRLKGQPARMAWSPDGAQIYVQTLEGNFGQANAKVRHYVFAAADGRRQDADAEPAWAAAYWTAKSAQASPDLPALKIEVSTEQRTQRTTSAPVGGEMARGATSEASGSSVGEAAGAAYGAQTVTVHSMRLKGETIGEFVNSVIVPGLTFAWGPKGSRVIAYADKDGKVAIMDDQGRKQEVEGSKDAILPAWSQDGSQLAWLRKDGRRKFLLQVSGVSAS